MSVSRFTSIIPRFQGRPTRSTREFEVSVREQQEWKVQPFGCLALIVRALSRQTQEVIDPERSRFVEVALKQGWGVHARA